MAKKSADALIKLRADDVLELAGLRVYFGFVDRKSIFEQAFRKAMASNHVARALGSDGS